MKFGASFKLLVKLLFVSTLLTCVYAAKHLSFGISKSSLWFKIIDKFYSTCDLFVEDTYFSVDDLKERGEFIRGLCLAGYNPPPSFTSALELINGWEISINRQSNDNPIKLKISPPSSCPPTKEVLPQSLEEQAFTLKLGNLQTPFELKAPQMTDNDILWQWECSLDSGRFPPEVLRGAIYTFTWNDHRYYVRIIDGTEYVVLVHKDVNAFDDGNGNHANDDHANEPDNKTVSDPEAAISPEVKMGVGVLSIFIILSILYYQARVRRAAIGRKPEEPVRPNSSRGSSKFKGSNPRRSLPKRQQSQKSNFVQTRH